MKNILRDRLATFLADHVTPKNSGMGDYRAADKVLEIVADTCGDFELVRALDLEAGDRVMLDDGRYYKVVGSEHGEKKNEMWLYLEGHEVLVKGYWKPFMRRLKIKQGEKRWEPED